MKRRCPAFRTMAPRRVARLSVEVTQEGVVGLAGGYPCSQG